MNGSDYLQRRCGGVPAGPLREFIGGRILKDDAGGLIRLGISVIAEVTERKRSATCLPLPDATMGKRAA
ncbi:MAG: hypothetical protein ABI270_03540 [Nitrosospira sp.]